jgi:transposase-like protein
MFARAVASGEGIRPLLCRPGGRVARAGAAADDSSRSIVASSSEEITPERQRHYLEMSKSQVERACALFDSLQEL